MLFGGGRRGWCGQAGAREGVYHVTGKSWSCLEPGWDWQWRQADSELLRKEMPQRGFRTDCCGSERKRGATPGRAGVPWEVEQRLSEEQRREQRGQNSVCGGEGPERHAHNQMQEAVSLSGSAIQERRSEWTYSLGQLHLKNASWSV